MEKAQMNLELSASQLGILRRVVRGETLWQRELPSIGPTAYFGDPPNPMELVSGADVAILLAGEGPELGLLEFRPRVPGRAFAAELTDLGTVYVLRNQKSQL